MKIKLKSIEMKISKSVFLIEDDLDDQELFVYALSKMENVTLYDIANNGREALSRLNNTTLLPDLIFSDIYMPVMNGIEYLSEFSKTEQGRSIPVIMLSSASELMVNAHRLGAKGFIQKTGDLGKFRIKLNEMINKNYDETQQTA
jgi:CheY-like chemotaxis protein